VLDEILRQLQVHGWGEQDIFAVHLSLEEALVNAIKHGNRSDPHKTVTIRCSLSARKFLVEIADQGQGFDPNAIPDPTDPEHIESPTGRGLMLMRTFMTKVEFNAKGNAVRMEKEKSPSEERTDKPAET